MGSIPTLYQACWSWLLLLLCSFTLHKEITAGAVNSHFDHVKELKRLTTDFWEWRLAISPEYGTKFGNKTHGDSLSNFTEAAFAEQVERAKEFRDTAKTINPRELKEEQEVNSLEVLIDLLTSFIDGYDFREYGTYNGLDVFTTPLKEMEDLVGWTKFDTIQDYENILQRYQAFISYLQQKQAFLGLAIENGKTTAIDVLEVAIKELESFPSDPEETFFYKPFKTLNSATLKNTARDMITNEIAPAVRKFTQYVINEYKPHARKELGVGSLPGGKAFYQACLRWHLSLDLTPREIHDMGKNEVKRISANIKRLMDKENFKGSVRAYITHMKSQTENMFHNQTQEEMLQNFKDTADLVHRKLDTILPKIPNSTLTIKSSGSPNFPTGKYMDPSLDGSRGGTFIANTWYPETRPRFSVMALTLHEAEPGHHTQMAYAIEQDIPNFRRAIEYRKYYSIPFNWPFYTAYVEGWALYAESLGEEMGLFSDSKSLFGRYTSEVLRACRLVVDTGIHEYNWTAQQAKDYLLEYTDLPEGQIDVEIKRYASYPGQATSYKIGELTIIRLRREAEKTLGDKFDLKHFHKIILELGPVPLSTVEKAVYNWISPEAGNREMLGGTTLYHITPALLSVCLLSITLLLKIQ